MSKRPTGIMSKNSPNQMSHEDGRGLNSRSVKEEVYEDVDTILRKAIDEIWEMFDDDGNGLFDIDETT